MNASAEYANFRDQSRKLNPPELYLNFCDMFADKAIWRSYDWLIDISGGINKDAVVVDIGCKFGHTLPLFLLRGASRAIGVDIIDHYIETGRQFTQAIYPQISFTQPDSGGYLPIPGGSVDFVLVNEVISHVNPQVLPLLFSEIARILKPGGKLMISDGNNIANADCRADLLKVYEAWEHGADGTDTGRDVVEDCFKDRRKNLIAERYPSLPSQTTEYLARNTSGLHGDYFFSVIDRYVDTGEFLERPYRHGICPAEPVHGSVMEFGFDPRLLELQLFDYGIDARQLDAISPSTQNSLKTKVADQFVRWKRAAERLIRPNAYRGRSWGFQILGVKR